MSTFVRSFAGTNNTVALFDGTGSLKISAIVDDGTNVTITNRKLALTNALAAVTASTTASTVTQSGTLNTTAGALASVGFSSTVTTTRSAGANSLVNYGIQGTASGGQINVGVYGSGTTWGLYAAGHLKVENQASIDGAITVGTGTSDAHVLNGNLTYANTPTAGPIKYGALNARLKIGQQIFTVNGTYTPSVGTKAVLVREVGGGGGGGGHFAAGVSGMGGGGASGEYVEKWIDAAANITGGAVTIGSAGTGGNNATGGTGGDTSVVVQGTTYTARGGLGGTKGAWNTSYGQGGGVQAHVGASGDVQFQQAGGFGAYLTNVGGATIFFGGAGGSSPLGSGGGQQYLTAVGIAATGYGGGGGGSRDNTAVSTLIGGAGTAGVVIIEEYA